MSPFGVIGGTGLTRLAGLEVLERRDMATPYGTPSAPLLIGRLHERDVIFLSRHGKEHQIPPHKVNYRANLWALRELGVEQVLAFAATGGITSAMWPTRIVVPDQIIDYTYGRAHTFFEEDLDDVVHIDFTHPYCQLLREAIIAAAVQVDCAIEPQGVYAATQGPRLETAAEIEKLRRDGCDIVGMTGMPEAALARELGLCYASISVVANWAAGVGDEAITMAQVRSTIEQGMQEGGDILRALLSQ